MFTAFLPFDSAVAQWFQTVFQPGANPFWDGFFTFVTRFGDGGVFWIALGLALLIPNKTRKVGCVMLIAMAINVPFTNGLFKNIFARPRPFDLVDVNWLKSYIFPGLIEKPHGYSFPSGHTASAITCAFAMFFASRPKWVGNRARAWTVIPIVLAVLVGISRIYLGVHYTTDVIAGAVTGVIYAALALLVFLLLEPIYEKLNAPIAKFMDQHMPKILK
jgi:undecaprenyl-diphosphatase